jgi:hypothetical protein
MPKEDVLPDAQGSREFRKETAKLVEEATPQRSKFEALARELECDEDEGAFDERLKRLAKAEPKPKPKTPPEKQSR